ncbi:hypothetical protein FH972_006801 [Carpinus fangiana]|uniref:Knr4/Smi1-like domain-containing protein n=1 Tax=Carpinus fangiana TaxID=176857 RepID=A0A5N6QVT0_9ROSI|nr:hypothetical protein FH972_006801 [Carpinus fangiana]
MAAPTTQKPLVCFSFAAYAKALIDHLKASNIAVFDGLSDAEFSAIEATYGFSFPPDLRPILQEGLPLAPGFPNWRSSSPQQLQLILKLPTLGILKQVSQRKFWCESWGAADQPEDTNEALAMAKKFLDKAPVLVPIYRNFYIPSEPKLAGNPVFYVNGGDIRVFSFDVTGFFQEAEFLNITRASRIKAPAWAATAARRIEFWTDVAARGDKRWWSGDLGSCLEEMFWRLRNGGWKDEEVREMMMMDGGDERKVESRPGVANGEEGVASHVRVLSVVLLRAGWTREDVLYSLGIQEENGAIEGKSFVDFQV